jgi:DNA mismatch repair protein MutS
VAALAGLPKPVLAQARRALAAHESRGQAGAAALLTPAARDAPPQISLFAPPDDALARALDALDTDALTPRQAHEALYRLKGLT